KATKSERRVSLYNSGRLIHWGQNIEQNLVSAYYFKLAANLEIWMLIGI
ncbi:6364_t:CDS:1, partial [Ambispora gerdemannii]